MRSRANLKQAKIFLDKEQQTLKDVTDKKKLVIKSNLNKEEYQKLIAFLATLSPKFSLVIRDVLQKNKMAHFLERINGHFLAKRIVSEWPGTKLLDNTAELYIFAVTPISIKVIMNSVENLYDWLEPKLPEDLCFLFSDSNPYFNTD
jgi:Mg/Co/Ni transporter MgtE